jgi:hypothetical protein
MGLGQAVGRGALLATLLWLRHRCPFKSYISFVVHAIFS